MNNFDIDYCRFFYNKESISSVQMDGKNYSFENFPEEKYTQTSAKIVQTFNDIECFVTQLSIQFNLPEDEVKKHITITINLQHKVQAVFQCLINNPFFEKQLEIKLKAEEKFKQIQKELETLKVNVTELVIFDLQKLLKSIERLVKRYDEKNISAGAFASQMSENIKKYQILINNKNVDHDQLKELKEKIGAYL